MNSFIPPIHSPKSVYIGFSSRKKKNRNTEDAASSLKPSDKSLQGEMRNLCRNKPELLEPLKSICNLPKANQAEALRKLQLKLNPPASTSQKTVNYQQPTQTVVKPHKAAKPPENIVKNSKKAKIRERQINIAAKATGRSTEELSRLSNADLKTLLQSLPKKKSRQVVLREPEQTGVDTISAQYRIDLGYQSPQPIPTIIQAPKGHQVLTQTTTDATGQVTVSNMLVPDQKAGAQKITREIARHNRGISIPQNIQQLAQQVITANNNLMLMRNDQGNTPETLSAFEGVVQRSANELRLAIQSAGLKVPPILNF